MHDFDLKSLNGTPLVVARNCARDGSLVAKRIAGSVGGVAPTGYHQIDIDRFVDQTYFHEMGERVTAAYQAFAQDLDPTTLVIGSPHRLSLYLGEVLNCKVLPAGLLGFARDWEEAASVSGAMVGLDHERTDRLWLWLKSSNTNDIPPTYLEEMQNAQRLVLVRSNSAPVGEYRRWGNLVVTDTFARWRDPAVAERLLSPIESSCHNVDPREAKALGHWEWGVPLDSVNAYRNAWKRCGKSESDFIVIEDDSVRLYQLIVPLWIRYLDWLGLSPRGITSNSYWIAHPGLERSLALIPVHFYRGSMLEPLIRQLFTQYGNRFESIYAFVNNTGGTDDSVWAQELLRTHCDPLDIVPWFGIGYDTVHGETKDVFGDSILDPHEIVSLRGVAKPGAGMPWDSVAGLIT